jgi:DNA mismatch repair protein MutL
MSRIQLLPILLANQIAAGEVVERPASVVKELLENSLDAGATQLDIHLLEGGRKLIRIQDNGKGIHPEDLPLALARHATSKIHHPADLAQIGTLGFRGEALASIASIARVTITSQHDTHDALSASAAQGRDMSITVQPASHPRGTTVEVADIFFNTPARRKFMKSDRTEFVHIEEMIKRMALVRPDVGFSLFHEAKLVKRYVRVAHDPVLRIEQVLGKSFMQGASRVEDSISAFRLEGWLADLSTARSSNDMQFCYVNGRMVRDKMLSHAIRLAFEDKIYPGRFPAYLLHLSCDNSAVDVNVHPTKHEVRFREARTAHDFVFSALQKALNPIVAAPTVGVDQTCTQVIRPIARAVVETNQAHTHSIRKIPGEPRDVPVPFEGGRPVHRSGVVATHPLGRVLTVLDKRVIIMQQDSVLRAVNWIKTLQNFLQAQWSYYLTQTEKPRVPLLSPIQLIHEQAESFVQKLNQLGFYAQIIGPKHLTIREIPRFLQGLPDESITPTLLQQSSDAIARSITQAWSAQQSLNFRDIERMLESICSLSKELISSKDYVPEMLI